MARLARARWLALRGERAEAVLEAPLGRGDLDRASSGESGAASEPPPVEPDESSHARAVLGVGRDATAGEIKAAYRALCRRYHPDRFVQDAPRFEQANELLREITRAYRTLTRPEGASDQ